MGEAENLSPDPQRVYISGTGTFLPGKQ